MKFFQELFSNLLCGRHHALVKGEWDHRDFTSNVIDCGVTKEMGEDPVEVCRYFARRKRINHMHFRNVRGTVPRYDEVFPHEGDGDMVANLKALQEVGYRQYIVPDHHIGLAGDSEWMHCSRAWQVGYIRGLMQALGV